MRYRPFGSSGLRVSEAALGTGTFGTRWGSGAEKPVAKQIFDAYVAAGGNFFDCASAYQAGQAEEFLGEFIRAERESFAISTKYTTASEKASILNTGNSRKTMLQSLDGSLKRLGTDYVDLFWVHYADYVTPVDEIMKAFDDVVRAGKARYVGFSDFPAWRVARAATVAELRGWSPVSAVQLEYSLAERSAERELIPMASAFGLAVVVWSALGGGLLTGKYRRGESGRRETGSGAGQFKTLSQDQEDRILQAVEEVAAALGATFAQVAIAWVRAQTEAWGVSFLPIIGARTIDQLADNLGALDVTLSADQLSRLNEASAVPMGFPHDFIQGKGLLNAQSGGMWDRLDRPSRHIR